MADDTGTINVSFWGQDLIEQIKENTTYKITKLVIVSNFGIKLASAANTICQESESKLKIDWDKLNCQDLNQVICSPEIMSAKLTKYLVCVNIDCKKKVTPFQGDITVTCTNSTCRRKMLVQRCKESFSLEITLQEPSGKQHNVTVFPKTLESFYQKKNKIIHIDELEDEMLEFNFLDFTVNRRKILIKMEDHLETLVDDRLEQVPEFTVSQQQKECNPEELSQQGDEVSQQENECKPEELSQQGDKVSQQEKECQHSQQSDEVSQQEKEHNPEDLSQQSDEGNDLKVIQ